jgi:DNA-binding response OmpR family regulator
MKKKILLIDDDVDLLRSFQVILEGNGFEVITATDGRFCFQILEKDKPDLVVLDVKMRTDFEGYNLLEEIKGHAAYKSLPVILLTGMRDQLGIDFFSVIQDDAMLPKVRYQDKPVNSGILVEMIQEMLME